ncbi:hypothetical protein LPW26_12020 [Rhodopseudomonas sp. HC1]|uniref:hypothetical protein n=1 Tax=Rhodopseudomonas infernalis TaxID=2897386 RepID=UPI001EE98DE2|nr:hypothetical protein [Rhodopseudomonas infernalis]MCG6205369.1 hypothetical protein [Rhodopseudomonas infernalis]
MAQITRVFENPGRAQAALGELKAQGFADAELTPIAEQRGRSLLRVDAPFGTALKVEAILKRHANGGAPAKPEPVAAPAAAPPAAEPQPVPRTQTAPASTAPAKTVGAKTAAPARSGSHDGVRSGPRTLSQLLGIPELIDSDTFFSGFPLLIRPTPKLTGDSTKRS